MNERREVIATFRVIIDGFAIDLKATGTLDEHVGLAGKMRKHEQIQPGNSPLLWPGQDDHTGDYATQGDDVVPPCGIHGEPMRRSKFAEGWYCPHKRENGGYCKEQTGA